MWSAFTVGPSGSPVSQSSPDGISIAKTGFGLGVHHGDDFVEGRLEGAIQPRPEQGVDQPAFLHDDCIGEQVFRRFLQFAVHGCDADPAAAKDGKLMACIRGQWVGGIFGGGDAPIRGGSSGEAAAPVEKKDIDRPTVILEVPCHHEPIAAVIAGAAQNRDVLLLGVQSPHQHRRSAAGIFHEHDAKHAVLFDGASIQFAHLGTAEIERELGPSLGAS